MAEEIPTNRVTEGDINLTTARIDWLETSVDEKTKALLDKDARYFFHQALSSPCLDVLRDCRDASMTSISGKKYYDFHGNNVHQIGYSNPKLIENITAQ